MPDEKEVHDLTPTRLVNQDAQRVNLRDLGFVGYVSPRALAEIDRNETRAVLVVTTATTVAFR